MKSEKKVGKILGYDNTHNIYQHEFLRIIFPDTLPPYILKIKIGAPLMLLQNIDPKFGLCNGTQLICRDFFYEFA